jgi:hypothetical protein
MSGDARPRTAKPSYLGLLNAIAVAEADGHAYVTAWAEVTPDPDVRAALSTVAAREIEHSMSFARRINELGIPVRWREDPKQEERMRIAASNRSDEARMELLGSATFDTGDESDILDEIFGDHSIDIATGALLGRYIAEERDTGRLLKCRCEALKANATENPIV